jgi:hypothetical protein
MVKSSYQVAIDHHKIQCDDYAKVLVEDLMRNAPHWACFSYGLSALCKNLLESSPQDKNREQLILELTAKGLEILILGDHVYQTCTEKPHSMTKSMKRHTNLIELFIGRKGLACKDLYNTHLEDSAHLYACALKYDQINFTSKESFKFLLCLESKRPVGEWTDSFANREIPLYIQEVAKNGHIYQLIRVIHFVLHYQRPSNVKSDYYKKNYIKPLVSACEGYSKDYKDTDGDLVGEHIQTLLEQLNRL